MTIKRLWLITGLALVATPVWADPFDSGDLQQWEAAYQSVVNDGRAAFTDAELGNNGVVCAQCHPNGANTHPETSPKFQKQLGKIAQLWERVNWCIRNPLEGKPLAADDPKMTGLLTYMAEERRGEAMEPGKR